MSVFTPPRDDCAVCPPSGYCDLECRLPGLRADESATLADRLPMPDLWEGDQA